MNDLTTITITKGLRDRVAALGNKGDTYEQIIGKLLSGVKNEATD